MVRVWYLNCCKRDSDSYECPPGSKPNLKLFSIPPTNQLCKLLDVHPL